MTLVKISAIGGVLTAGTMYLYRQTFNKNIRETKCYVHAMTLLREHPKAISYLGEPLREGYVDIGESDNVRWFSVPIRGSKSNGSLYCEFKTEMQPEVHSELLKVEIKFDNIPNKSFVIMEE